MLMLKSKLLVLQWREMTAQSPEEKMKQADAIYSNVGLYSMIKPWVTEMKILGD